MSFRNLFLVCTYLLLVGCNESSQETSIELEEGGGSGILELSEGGGSGVQGIETSGYNPDPSTGDEVGRPQEPVTNPNCLPDDTDCG